MKVQDVMTTDVTTTNVDASLKEAALELVRHRISGMPVVNGDGHVVGVVSEADILAKEGDDRRGGSGFLQWLVDPGDPWITARFDAVTVGDAMSRPALTIGPDRPLTEVATIMLDQGINRLPVVDEDGKLIGLVSRGDLVRAFARPDAEIRHEIEEDVIRKALWLDPTTVDVTVTNGVVTLSGEVASAADAELLPTFTRKVPGVVEVSSSLTHRAS
ncbi:MAG: CBS domain-containing protein [Gaiellaceae bacterium]